MDGSAKDFLEVLENVGLSSLTSKRKYLKVLEKFEFIDGQRKISVEPNENFFEVDFELNYKNDIIGKQRNIVNFQKNNLKDVSSSRTFCLFEDIEKIKKAGLAKGGSLENAVVIKNDKVLNDGGLRNSKEFVNHKILDLAGDFLLSGYRVLGKIKCIQGGHELTNTFLRKLFSNNSSIEITENVKSFISKDTVIKPSIKIAVNA
jgi:UDP-3-O-[3-hydroxymyristoyl] N-acetylglucosamine deacetylase